MKRLTHQGEQGPYWDKVVFTDAGMAEDVILDRLAYYEDTEEQGRLVVLPCKVGDKAFFVINGTIYEAEICIVQWYKHSRGVVDEIRGDVVGGSVSASFSDWGKTVFLTREEAEQALKGGAET